MPSDSLYSQRKIIHIDMDCFYAAVEMRDNPNYQNIPLAIGGRSQRRGVLSTCNYLARQFGVHSAMPVFQAKQLCPELLVVPGRMQVYVEVSQKLRNIFYRYTHIVEPLSLDEAFLDVSDCKMFQGSATYIAQDIRLAIQTELNLTASAGVSYCKFLAKIASDENKPNGQCVITPESAKAFIKKLPLKKIPGVGKVAQQNLADKGLFTCADIMQYSEQKLLTTFGKLGQSLISYSQGIDNRPIQINRERKSVAVERTFEHNLFSEVQCLEHLKQFYNELEGRLEKHLDKKIITKLGVKLKFSDFTIKSSERKYSQLNLSIFEQLLHQLIEANPKQPIRLLGLSVGLTEQSYPIQLSLIDNE
ncbi:DNA polymerase IV [Psychromonas sp. RZ22]|nr:DNA polymerase IV [Psychromonas sp. RZ22]